MDVTVRNEYRNTTTDAHLDDLCTTSNETNMYYRYMCIAMVYAPVSVIVDRYVSPFWYVIGFVGNALTVKIWSKRMKRRNMSAMFLSVLAITDIMLLMLHVFMELRFAWGIPTLDLEVWCPTFFVLYMFAQYMSPLLVLGFTIERFVSIMNPFKSERFSRRNRASIEIGLLATVALALAMPQIFGWKFMQDNCQGTDSDFFGTWIWISDGLVFCIFPLTSLILNIFVMRAASRSATLRHESVPMSRGISRKNLSQRHSSGNPSTATLLCVSFYRIFTVIPVSIILALQYSLPPGDLSINVHDMNNDPVWKSHFKYLTAKKIIDEIGLSQYSCNIFIYLATARHFRHEFKQLISIFRKNSRKFVHSLQDNGTSTNDYQLTMSTHC